MSKRCWSGKCTPPVVTSARRVRSSGLRGLTKCGIRKLDVESDEHGVAVLDDVVSAFEAHLRFFSGLGPGAGVYYVLPVDDLGGDEAAFHVRVDASRRLPHRRAFADGPGPALFLFRGEEGYQPEQTVRAPHELLEARGLYS